MACNACLISMRAAHAFAPAPARARWRSRHRRASPTVGAVAAAAAAAGVSSVNKEKSRPRRIILLRHGESEGNVDEATYRNKPDHRIELSEKGKAQAQDAGRKLAALLGPDETIYAYVSPYMRGMQTLYELGKTSGVWRMLGVREEPRIREQDFGNLQDESMETLKKQRMRFGRFFFRFRDGESAADVYDRVTSFRETLRNDMDFGRFNCSELGCTTEDCNIVIVTHGLTLRVFLMRWFKWDVEMFENVHHNPDNCELIVLERGAGGRYSLLPHHSAAELKSWGFTPQMIADQNWAMTAAPDELNKSWPTSSRSFFDTFPARLEKTREREHRYAPPPPSSSSSSS